MAGFEELVQRLRRSSVQILSHGGGGSGIVWDASGHILTNSHVARGDEVGVVDSQGRRMRARVIQRDQTRDLALIETNTALEPAAFGDSSQLRVGQIVAAIGNPLGVPGAVTTGIIHSRGESRFIQADVRLAPGNSGGMLANTRGEVIGINTMIYAGLALAIPSNTAAAFARGENIDRPLLGIAMQPIDLRGAPALVILRVEPGGVADRHGLILGDVLPLSVRELHEALDSGNTVLLRYLRGNEVRQAGITLRAEAQAA